MQRTGLGTYVSRRLRTFLNRYTVWAMTNNQHRKTVAAEVRAALARDGRSAAALAGATGISKTSLSRKLRGQTPLYVEEIVLIAHALGIDAGALLAPAVSDHGTNAA